MRFRYILPLRLRSLLLRGRVERELDEELRDYLERRTEEELAGGATIEEARSIARRALGSIELRKEECRDTRGVNFVFELLQDLRYAARSLSKARAFTIVCIISLGIGMAPVIAIPYVARIPQMPPPGVNTEGLVEVITTTVESRPAANSWSYPDYMDLRSSDTGMTLIPWASAPSQITLPSGSKLPIYPLYVSTDYFKTLGVKLARGSEFERTTDAAVIVAYEFWQKELSADPEIIGKTIKFDNVPYTVTGIAPKGFVGHLGSSGKSLFAPLERYPLLLTDNNARFDRGKEWLNLNGKLSEGVSVAQASAAVARITSLLAKEYPATNKLKAGIVEPYDPVGVLFRPQFRIIQTVALTLTGVVLLVVCLNLSGMLQVRSAMRERELSIRQAIGATRLRLARHLLTEVLLLAAAGGTLASLVLFNAPNVVSRPANTASVGGGTESRLFHDRDLPRRLPSDQLDLWISAGHAFQPSRDHLRFEGRRRRGRTASRPLSSLHRRIADRDSSALAGSGWYQPGPSSLDGNRGPRIRLRAAVHSSVRTGCRA